MPSALYAALQKRAKADGATKAQIARDALAAYLGRQP